MRTIKVMADYQCFPLWEASPGEVGNIDPDDLPISHILKERLAAWARAFDATLSMDYPPIQASRAMRRKRNLNERWIDWPSS
jgi:hypothetical protein